MTIVGVVARRGLVLLAMMATWAGTAEGATLAAAAPAVACTDASGSFSQLVLIDGEATRAAVSLPPAPPKGVVVLAHGYPGVYPGGDANTTLYFETWAKRAEVVVVAPEYRGTTAVAGSDSVRTGTPIRKASEDLAAFARAYRAACPSARASVLFSQSFGAVMGAASLRDEPRTFDAWFVEGGLYDLAAYAAVIAAADAGLAADLAAELGPLPGSLQAYWAASPYAFAGAIARKVDYASLYHGAGEYVPIEFATRMYGMLRLAGLPTRLGLATTGLSTGCAEYAGTAFETPYNGETVENVLAGSDALPSVLAAHLGDPTDCPLWREIGSWVAARRPVCEANVREDYVLKQRVTLPSGCSGPVKVSLTSKP